MKILLTGASGLLGGYMLPILQKNNVVTTLQRHDADVVCDLAKETPDLSQYSFDLVIHAAGTSDNSEAIDLNYEGTKRLLKALEKNPPEEFVYLSSWEVYSPDSGENVKEDHRLWAVSKAGQSKALAEEVLSKWCEQHGVLLTILRPARMFGKGMKGEMANLFNDVVHGRYLHVRGNDARLSLVCATDVAEAAQNLHSIGGIYNICDEKGATWLELAEAMSANSGAMKRQIALPEKWAALAWKLIPWIPAVRASLSPAILDMRKKSLTLSAERIKETLDGWNPYPTLEVISRENRSYSYLDK
ncbi:MAG: NAD(P)-dependent oxidoreductase [Muribaculaceae bacterium]|nr:NAD(P)-dependent oxidoreductase [Muribaculaceae bacterium]